MKTKPTFGWKSISVLSVLIVILFGASVSFSAHHEEQNTTASDVKQEAIETYKTLKDYTLAHRDDAVAAADTKLETIDAKLDAVQSDLDKRWQAMSEATRKKNREMIRKLKKEREEVAEWYGGMRHSSAEAWEEVKKGFADSYDRLEQAFQNVKRDLDKDK